MVFIRSGSDTPELQPSPSLQPSLGLWLTRWLTGAPAWLGSRSLLAGDAEYAPTDYILNRLSHAAETQRVHVQRLVENVIEYFLNRVADDGLDAGEEFEQLVGSHGCQLLRPDRKNEQPRHGSLGGVRQWIESIIQTTKGQLSLERHGARTINGLAARISLRLLALAAGIWHNHLTGQPARAFAAYGR